MSAIDPTKPTAGIATTQSVRDNFATAKTEIEVLQAFQAAGPYLTLAGGTLTGPLLLNANPTDPLGAVTKQYADLFLPLAGGTTTGPVTLGALLTAISITMTGTLTVGNTASGNAVVVMNAPGGGTRALRMQTAGINRWQLSPVTTESTGDAGSDFTIGRYSDAGTNLGSALITRRGTAWQRAAPSLRRPCTRTPSRTRACSRPRR